MEFLLHLEDSFFIFFCKLGSVLLLGGFGETIGFLDDLIESHGPNKKTPTPPKVYLAQIRCWDPCFLLLQAHLIFYVKFMCVLKLYSIYTFIVFSSTKHILVCPCPTFLEIDVLPCCIHAWSSQLLLFLLNIKIVCILLLFFLFIYPGQYRGSSIADDLRGHHSILRDCIEQLTTIETSRASLVSHLREALQEQVC